GYARTVLSLTENAATKTVTVETRQTKAAEVIKEGSISSADNFTELSSPSPQGGLNLGFPLQLVEDLSGPIYQDNTILVEALPGSRLDLNATLALAANFSGSKLTEFETTISGLASFNLAVHAKAGPAL